MKGGKEINGNMKVGKMGEKGKHEMKKPSRCAKRGERREKWERFPEKSSEVGPKTRKEQEKSGLYRAKNECVPSKKCRKLSLKRGKAG